MCVVGAETNYATPSWKEVGAFGPGEGWVEEVVRPRPNRKFLRPRRPTLLWWFEVPPTLPPQAMSSSKWTAGVQKDHHLGPLRRLDLGL